MFMETYGTPMVRALTRASRAFYTQPPEGFVDVELLKPRSVLYVANTGQEHLLEQEYAALSALASGASNISRIGLEAMLAAVPCLRADVIAGGLMEEGACDIDVHALHQGYLRGFRQRGGMLQTGFDVAEISHAHGLWQIFGKDGSLVLARKLVNAAGAWADEIAGAAGVPRIGLEPRRRTAFTFPGPADVDFSHWPSVVGLDESYYFKPDAGQLLGSPANADPMPPHDVVPEELDVATGIYNIEQVTTLTIRRPSHTWAGLRSFVPDGDLVIGWDNHVDGFFWVAAQGGYGIQSAAGASALALSLLLGEALPAHLRDEGVVAEAMSPSRLR
jgi:D-arginine dehydrogenase